MSKRAGTLWRVKIMNTQNLVDVFNLHAVWNMVELTYKKQS